MPGQGRSVVDTHHDLPHVHASEEELEQDLEPFRVLNKAPMGMTGHVVYDVWIPSIQRPCRLLLLSTSFAERSDLTV